MKLSPITKPQPTKIFAVGDIETMNWTKFIVLGYFDGTRYLEFKKLKDFFLFLATDDGPTEIFFHFGGKFDILFLLEEALENKSAIPLAIVPRGSSMLYLEVRIGERKYTFRDSAALLPFSLKSLTDNFGVETKKGDWDHSTTTGYSKGLSEYLRSDCLGLFESLTKYYTWPLIVRSGGTSTMASQAIRVLRLYLKEPLWGLSDSASAFCRKAYLGGRTEIFRPLAKKGPLYEYDVNSLYPFVMRDNYFPIGNGTFVYEFEKNQLGIYEVTVTAPAHVDVPCLGVILDGKYIFPTGTFDGYFTSVELEYAKTQGYEFKVKRGYAFPKKQKLFTEYIDDLYNIRLQSPKNSVPDIIAKLLMNSSYGRFGMNLDKENIGFEFKEGVEEYKIIKVGGKNVQLFKEPVKLKTFTHPAIAAFVTSYARIHMHKIFRDLGDDLYYTDTDSIFTTRLLDSGKALGALKHEATYESAVFLLPKTYFAKGIKNKIAMKGFDRKKISQFEFDDFHNALEGDLRRFKIENEPKFATLKSALAQKKIVTLTKKSEKQLRSAYNKRIIFKKDGEFFTKPIFLGGKTCQKNQLKRPKPPKKAKKSLKRSTPIS